ncbi:hypothetical protein IFR05_009105 [Cadophora sp. M221]|nr:hypothetical protein IFR05_009105 [Cadophora sp. M221]
MGTKTCLATKQQYSCGCIEYVHKDCASDTTTTRVGKCRLDDSRAAAGISHPCSRHGSQVQKPVPELAEMVDKDEISPGMRFLGKKIDTLISVIEANTAQTKINATSRPAVNPTVEVQQNAPEVKTDANKNLEASKASTTKPTTRILALDGALKKSMIKLHTAHVTTGLNKLLSDIEIATESARRMVILDASSSKSFVGVSSKELEKDMKFGWKELDDGVKNAFKKAEGDLLRFAEEAVVKMLESLK